MSELRQIFRERNIALESLLESTLRLAQASASTRVKVEPGDPPTSLPAVRVRLEPAGHDTAPPPDPVQTRLLQEDSHDVLEILSDSEPDDDPDDSDVEVSRSLMRVSSRSSSILPIIGIDPSDGKAFGLR